MFEDLDFHDHPDTIEIELAGETHDWFLGRKSFRLAEERGVEINDILQTAQKAEAEGNLTGAVDAVATLAWSGFLVFDEDLEVDAVADRMSLQDIPRLMGTIMGEFKKLKDAKDAVNGGNGNGKEEKS